MITRKYITDIPENIIPYITEFNSALRIGYNRLKEGMSLSEAEKYISKGTNFQLMDVSFVKLAVNKAKSLVSKDVIVVFGGKKNLEKRSNGKITKEQWAALRSPSILLRGSSHDQSGNRKSKLDISNNQVIFKPSRGIEIPIKLPHLSNKTRKDLLLLQTKCELHEACFSLEITRTSVNIIYDESVITDNYTQITPIKDRVLAIDLNPNYIACVVMQGETILHKEILDLSDLSLKEIKSTKRKHWILEASRHIAKLARHYRCNLAIENLNIKSKNHNKGKKFNRLVNNIWIRNAFINNLKKRANLLGIKCLEIYCAYSSFVGQMLNYKDYDSIAAAIEIGRRAQHALRKCKYEVLPKKIDVSLLSNPWKEAVIANGIDLWLDFYNYIKNTKTSYRVLFSRDKFQGVSFDLLTCNSCILIHKIT